MWDNMLTAFNSEGESTKIEIDDKERILMGAS